MAPLRNLLTLSLATLASIPLLVSSKPTFEQDPSRQHAVHHASSQHPVGYVDPDIEFAERDGFFFNNPETNCKFVSQPFIYKKFKTLETDGSVLFQMIHRDVHFTIVGSHPGAGVYHDLMHFYVNALRRVALVAGTVHPETFRVYPKAIHGGCDTEWSIQEMNFQGVSNSGTTFDIINVWVTRWDAEKKQMVEIRTYVDAMKVTQLIHESESWWNGSRHIEHLEWMPGPYGMPNLTELYALMPEADRPPPGEGPGEGLTGKVVGYMLPEWEQSEGDYM